MFFDWLLLASALVVLAVMPFLWRRMLPGRRGLFLIVVLAGLAEGVLTVVGRARLAGFIGIIVLCLALGLVALKGSRPGRDRAFVLLILLAALTCSVMTFLSFGALSR